MKNCGEGKKVYIRKLTEEDYFVCREVNFSHFAYKQVFTEKFMQRTWQDLNAENVFSCTIVEKHTGEICGFCQLRSIDTSTPEVGIDIRDGYMGRGYAQEAVRLLIDYASQIFDVNYFIWKADKTNAVSRHIAEKLGGELISEKAAMEQWIIDYGRKLGALKEEDISYVCTYRIENVNGAYCGNTPIGKLMHDFSCTDAADMYYGILADRVRFFKESKEGKIMCRAMEDMRVEKVCIKNEEK